MDELIFKGFYEKLPVKSRKGRGGTYPYVSADDITDRMNNLFMGNWSTMVVYQEVIGDEIIIRVRVEVRDADNVVYCHEGFGGHKMNPTDEPGNGFKSAYSKALVNACRRWGVGLFLTEDEEHGVVEHKQAPAVASKPATEPTTPVAAVASVGNQFVIPPMKSKMVSETATIVQEKPKAEMPKIPGPGMNIPIPPRNIPPEIAASIKKTVSSMPKIPTQASSIVSQQTEPTTVVVPAGENTISDVQLLAIDSLVETKGFKYDDLAEHVLGEIRNVNTLTHDEAIAVIQYGNKLYRENKQR